MKEEIQKPTIDLYNGEVITYTIESCPIYSLVSKMLDQAFKRMNNKDSLLIHSDQGCHYQMHPFRQSLKERGIIQKSMLRKGKSFRISNISKLRWNNTLFITITTN
ncbi:hypothetical protein SAMN04488600_102570 [Paenibacillus polymyxa]|nr:hypothetical protein SAMN04488600_102570 [Paenibacillus polymyxa]